MNEFDFQHIAKQEVTYNGDKHELYLDAYKKFENKKIEVKDGVEGE